MFDLEFNLPSTWIWWTIGISFLLLLVPPIRTLLGAVISTFLTPAFLTVITSSLLWVWWMVKKILNCHRMVLRNLMRPHNVIFPTLEKAREKKRT